MTFAPPEQGGAIRDTTVLVRLGPHLSGFSYDQFASSQGVDLRFSDVTRQIEWPYDIEQWDTNGVSSVWLHVPAFSNGTQAVAFWGNPAILASPAYTTNGTAWADHYLGVWHLNQTELDSTAATNHGRCVGCDSWPGIVAEAKEFDGINDYIQLESRPVPDPPRLGATNFTLSAWIFRRGNGDTLRTGTGGFELANVVEPIVTKGLGEGDRDLLDLNYFLGIRQRDGVLAADFEQGSGGTRLGENGPVTGHTVLPTNTWVHVAASYDGTWRLYVNGVLDGTAVYNQPVQHRSSQPAAIAAGLNSSGIRDGAFNGAIDEVRIASTALASNVIHTAWMNVQSNDLFNGYGVVSLQNPGAPYVVVMPATQITSSAACLNATLVSTGGHATVVSMFYGPDDGGTDPLSWSNHVALGVLKEGLFSVCVTGLQDQVRYSFRARASNDYAVTWAPVSESFITGDLVTLVVTSVPAGFGTYLPYGLGSHAIRVPAAISIEATVTNIDAGDGVRWGLAGWTGAGSVPATGTTDQSSFVLSEDSILTWQWAPTDYYLEHPFSTGGRAQPASRWIPVGATVTVAAVALQDFRFVHWTGDVAVAVHTNTTIDVVMDRPRSVTPVFRAIGTSISGAITNSLCWTLQDSPFVIVGNVSVPSGVTLCVEPGVDVQLLADVSLSVAGAILAIGTPQQPVRFRNHASVANGGSLIVDSPGANYALTASGRFEHCVFTQMGRGEAAVQATDAHLQIVDCVISNIPGKVFLPTRSRVVFMRNVVRSTGEGINVVNCAGLLSSNVMGNVLGNADAIDVDFNWQGSGNADMIVEWNSLSGSVHFNADAVDVSEARPIVRYNRIFGFTDKGISLGPIAYPLIYNNLIDSCSIGIQIKDSSDPVIVNNTIVNCTRYGVNSYEKGQGPGGGGLGSMTNVLIWNCNTNIWLEDGSTLSVGYSLVPGASPWPGPSNLTNDPLFVSLVGRNFELRPESPCVNRGWNDTLTRDRVDLNGGARPQGGTADIGCFEFPQPGVPNFLSAQGGDLSAGLSLEWASITNCSYSVLFSSNLYPLPHWQVLVSNLVSDTPRLTYSDAAPTAPHGFYRVLCE